ncbi:MAG: hypothetical protein H8D55_02675 [Deltaproteobacteria bacterium]|nr:hypothetical protein [Deltaproteobacteria bacterium]
MEQKTLDPEKCAMLIRGAIGVQQVKQVALAEKVGLNRVVLNMFLNRKLNLLDDDIRKLLSELRITKQAEDLSSSENVNHERGGE